MQGKGEQTTESASEHIGDQIRIRCRKPVMNDVLHKSGEQDIDRKHNFSVQENITSREHRNLVDT